MDQDTGWDASADAWVSSMGDQGDRGRAHVLDTPMLERLGPAGVMLDIGCGEGRFCRMAAARGFETIGIDPTAALLDIARGQDPNGRYEQAIAENLPLADASVDLAVFYLSLIDIPDIKTAVNEMNRVLRPGGRCLIANLNSHNTAAAVKHNWKRHPSGAAEIIIDDYLVESANWQEWAGIRIRNWHRPMVTYMQLFLDAGMRLVHFDEPKSTHPDLDEADRYNRAPYFLIMEWVKPD